ncbi:MAG: hypothetical protein K0Q50_2490 [Vampirovibrio sp.]|jgi:hypothetical protein|nr:hypothetical protein [Vampirovibrio sp.]
MTTLRDHDQRQDKLAYLLQNALGALGPELINNPQLAEVLHRTVDEQLAQYDAMPNRAAKSADYGIADLIGLGSDAPADMGDVEVSPGVVNYDDAAPSERLLAAAHLYYLCIHEKLGVFKVVDKLQKLFLAGTLKVSNGPGAYRLYRFDRHGTFRYRKQERMRAYKQVFGYTNVPPAPGGRANTSFHGLFTHFIQEVAKFWRDKRISEVIRERATDPTFGSMAIVRRAGLDLRNNLKNSTYGYINVLRIETSQALAECFEILEAPDLRAQFGADNAWDLIELVMWQHFHQTVHASTMNRMAVSGREVLQWLAEPYILQTNRTDFETLLMRVAESAEEWLSSEEGRFYGAPTPPPRPVYKRSRNGNGLGQNRMTVSIAPAL